MLVFTFLCFCISTSADAAAPRLLSSASPGARSAAASGSSAVREQNELFDERLESSLAKLREAVRLSGGEGLTRLEASLPHLLSEVQGSAPPTSDSKVGNATAAKTGQGLKFAAASSEKQTPGCVFDDMLFSLTPAGKAELSWELQHTDTNAQLNFIRRGGWWQCASADKPTPVDCHCKGNVRIVDIDRQPISQVIVDAGAVGGVVSCTSLTFGGTPGQPWPSVDASRSCECSPHAVNDGASWDGFHLEKRFTSTTLLQEAWIMLTRLLSRTSKLPTGTGDRTYQGIENWAARMPAWQQNNFQAHIFERLWIVKFIRQMAPHIAGPKCLEWGDPSSPGHKLNYVHIVPSCTEHYDMQFDHNYWKNTPMHVAGNVVHSDILSLPTILGPHLQMNTIFATQVFEHVADPLRAATALFAALAPSGTLVFTAPQSAPYHKVPHDYYRYTVEGVKYTLVQAGFCVPNMAFVGGGDFVFSIAANAGLQVEDFSMEEVEGAYQQGFEQVSHAAIGIHVIAFKSPHAACNDPTSGWEHMTATGMRA